MKHFFILFFILVGYNLFGQCQTINAVLNSSSPASGAGGIIRICPGQSVTFNGSGTFSSNGSGATYTWNFGNGTSGNGTSATVVYASPGSYVVNLKITDPSNCSNANNLNVLVQVSTTPTFTTNVANPSVCLGQSTTISGVVAPTPFIVNCAPPVSGVTFIPDGAGLSYTSSINVSCFTPGQTVTAASQIQDVCVNMEHSYLGDLDISIICPNGQQVFLKSFAQGGGGTYLGAPLDDPAVGPGVGSNYCFSMSAVSLLVGGPTVIAGTPPSNSIAAGTYLPIGNFSGLIGCPLDGNWSIKVTDNLNADNGYIFSWGINFAPGLAPAAASFTPVIVSQTWTGANITSTSGSNITVAPTTVGTQCYTFTAVDNFNCSYNTVQCLNVVNGPFAGTNNTFAGCNTAASTNLFGLLGSGVSTTGSWSGPAPALTGGYLGTLNPALYAAGTYNYTYTVPASGSCPASSAVIAVTIRPNPQASLTYTNASCGSNNGVIQIANTSSGGQTVVSFGSSAGVVSGQLVTGLPAGTDVITLTNNYGCVYTTSAVLGNSPAVTDVALTPNNIICGSGTGGITIGAVTGGTAPYTYAVNGGAFSSSTSITGLASGTYTITVKDSYGCTFNKTVSITVTPGPTAISSNISPAGCGLSNGSHNVTGVTGGTAAYTFSINGVSTPNLSSNLSAGNYIITVKDANGCTLDKTITVGVTAGPTGGTVLTTNAACGAANGTSTLTGATGGTGPYQYSFDGGAFGSGTTASGLAAGSHNVVIKDANTCTLNLPYTVVNNGSPSITLNASTNVLCNGGNNGSINTSASGGSGGPFTYTLTNPFQTNGNGQFSTLAAGVYTVQVRDVAGCITGINVTITEPASLTLNLSAVAAKCYGTATGTVSAVATGGTGIYQYQIDGTGYQGPPVFTTVAGGTHIIQVKDANNCTLSQTVAVSQPPALAVSITTQSANCTAANGLANATATGGTSPYSYSWTGGAGSSATTNNVVSGTYNLTVTDAKGCTVNGTAVIGVIPGGSAAITGSTNITCKGISNGVLTANMVSGGSAPYNYLWTPSGQVTSTATNLAPTTYTCRITDNYGCIALAIGTLTEPSQLGSIVNSNNVKCFGASTGTISATGIGGTAPYTYFWPALGSTLTTVANVSVGTYSCQITDANNCVLTSTVTVNQPNAVVLSSSVTTANCGQANGSATVTATGGTPGYTYSWSSGSTTSVQAAVPAGTYTIQVADANSCSYNLAATIPSLSGPTLVVSSYTNVSCYGGNNGAAVVSASGGMGTLIYLWNTGQNTPAATNFLVGVHTVSVTDAAGCVASANVTITQPPLLTLSIAASNPKCFGFSNGSGTGTALGGTSPYTYAWTGGGGTGATSNPLGAGTYGLNVTDAKGCVATATMALVNPPAMTSAITSTNVSCFNACNGVASGSTTNNVGIVTYYWTGGPSPVTAQTLSGVCAGTYTLTATDQNNCIATAQVIITQPAVLSAGISSSGSVTCNGGTNGFAQVSSTGGTGVHNYSWTGAASSSGNSANANNLPAGTYTVTVTDQHACTTTAQAVIYEPAPLSTTLTTTNPKCNGASDGTANVAFTGGAGTTTFLWLPGLQSGSNNVTNLSAGGQSVTITSNGACVRTLTFTLTQPPPLTATVTSTNSNCNQNNGSAIATVGGGTLPYTYLWSNGVTTLNNPSVYAGAYTFVVKDNNLCSKSAVALVNDIAGPTVVVTGTTAVKCFNGNDGAATTTITGGVSPYVIAWNNNASTSSNVNNFTAGFHNITVTDAANCVGTASLYISQPTQLTSAIGSYSNVTCYGLQNGQATMLVAGGTPSYSYSWTPGGQSSATMINVGANSYTCYVADANNCKTSQVVLISQPQALLIAASGFSNCSCFGGSNGQIITTTQGGTPGYTYAWTPSQINSGVLNGLSAGNYSLTITDSKNCSVNANFSLIDPLPLTSSYVSSPAKCGVANGSATLTVNGGTPAYLLNWNTTPLQQGLVATGMGPGANWNCVITDAKGCSKTQTVSVADAPSPVITSVVSTSVSCFGGQDGTIIVNYIQGTPNYTVSWSNPIVPASQVTSGLSQTVTGIGAGSSYQVTVTDSYGCSASGFANIGQPNILTMNVSPLQTICYGQSAQIYAQGGGGTFPYTYTWSPVAFSGAGPHTVSPTTTSVYNVNMYDAHNCITSPAVVTVNVTPPLTISAFSTTACHGTGVALMPAITSPGRGAPYDFSWSNGTVNAAVAGSTLNVTANYTATPNHYTVTVTDGCSLPAASAVFTINVNPLPTGNFTANTYTACAPASITFSATSNNSSTDTYVWYYDTKDVMGTTNPLTYNIPGADTISVKLEITSADGCVLSIVKPNYITTYPQPIASFVPTPPSTSILDPTINFMNTSIGGNTYSWSFGDPAAIGINNYSSAFNAVHTYGFVGAYYVSLVVTSSHQCVAVATEAVEITADFAIYVPNAFSPDANHVNDMFQPVGVGINEDNYRMDIFDRWGEVIFTSNNFQKGWDGTVKGNKIAEQGVYIYKLQVFDMQGNKHPMVGHVTVLREN